MVKQTIFSLETIDLTELAPTGEAIGDLDGVRVYVPLGAPGERVRVEIVEQTRLSRTQTVARARLVEILTPSPQRITPLCEYFGRCGGCDWQHLRYATQLAQKRERVWQELVQNGKLDEPPVRNCLPSLRVYDYRNAALFRVGGDGRPAYPAVNPRESIAVDECPILEPPLEDELHKAALMGVSVRREWGIRVPEPIGVGNFDYYVGPKSEFPVNTLMADQLVAESVAAMEPTAEQSWLDLYCGVGLLTLPLAVMCADVIGIEPSADAGRDARRNVAAIRSRLYNKIPPRILTSEVAPALAKPEVKTRQWYGAAISAPSRGLNLAMITQLAKLGLQRLVYLSSEVGTLGRDIKALIAAGFQLAYVQPLDMMPQTRHVQTVARLDWVGK